MDITRTATNVIHLLNLHHKDDTTPLLPLSSDDPLAYENSPLATLRPRGTAPSEVVSQLLGFGPWSIRAKLHLPADCTVLHPTTTRSRDSTVHVSHMLCFTMRVSKGDDLRDTKTGKRKVYEIIVRLPVHILSVGYPLLLTSDWLLTHCLTDSATRERSTPHCRAILRRLIMVQR
jgi:hypothetical protein